MFDKDLVFLSQDFDNKEDFFNKICAELFDREYVKEDFYKSIMKREEEYPTGLPTPIGVAIPHTDGSLVNKDKICVVTLKKPLKFNEMGGDEDALVDVEVIFLMAIKDGEAHLEQLQNIIQMIQNEDLIGKIRIEESEEKVLELIENNL